MVAVGFIPFVQQRALRKRRVGLARTRIACALAASALVHLSVVHGLPSGAPRARVQALALEARLAPTTAQPAASEVLRSEAVGDDIESLPATDAPTTQPGHETQPARAPVDSPAPPVVNGPSARNAPRALPTSADPVYYSARELDDYPAPAHPLRFSYPAHMMSAGVAGNVMLDIKLDVTGAVDQVAVVAAEPPGHFEEHARATLASARFIPGRREGRAVRSRVTVQVNYDPAVREGVVQ